jgi:hypothetical protein
MCALRNQPLWSSASPGAPNSNHPKVLLESRNQSKQERPEFRAFLIVEQAWPDTGNFFTAINSDQVGNTFIDFTGSQGYEDGGDPLAERSLTWGGVALVRVAWGSDSWKE